MEIKMKYEDNDRIFTVLKSGRLSFGRIKLALEKVTEVPSNSGTFHLFQVIWDDYRKMWQWLEDVKTPLIVYDRDFDVGDRVIYGKGLRGTVRKVIETATLLTDSETVIDDVKIKDIEYISTIYPSAMIEYRGWIGEVLSVTRKILCQCDDGMQFTFQTNEPEILSPKKKKKDKKDKNVEVTKSRLEKLRDYPFHQENIKYFPGNRAMFSKKELKRATWFNGSSIVKSFKSYKKYTKKPVAIKSITITNIEVFWTGYIPFMLDGESAEKISHNSMIITDSELAKVHPLKPNGLSSIDCKDFINFGYGSYFQYFLKETDIQMELKRWEFQFKSRIAQNPSENFSATLDHNRNEIISSLSRRSYRKNAIRVKKINSSRCYEISYWGEETTVTMPGWKLASDKRYCKISSFKMGFPFVTKRFVFPDHEKLGILFQKSNSDEDELKSASVLWGKIDPSGTIDLLDSGRESPYDLTYVVPPCLTSIGSILYNPVEDDKFQFGVITRFDILEFGKVHVYDPIRGRSTQDISRLRSVHRLDSRRNCGFWGCLSITSPDATLEVGDTSYANTISQSMSLRTNNLRDLDVCDVGNGSKYYELDDDTYQGHYFYHDLKDRFTDNLMESKWQARIELEKKRFDKDLPDGIWVCGYKDRKDLLTVVFEGNAGSILEDFLYIADIQIRSSFPKNSHNGVPYQIRFINLKGSLLQPNRYFAKYNPDSKCSQSLVYMVGWSVTSTWDPQTSTLVGLLKSIKDKFQEHLFKYVPEPVRMELNSSGLQTEYAILQKYNFQLAIEILDSIGSSCSYPVYKQPWLYYFIRKYYSQAIIRIKNRYDKWILIDKKRLQENLDLKEVPSFPFLPLSKDLSSSVMDRLIYFNDLMVEGKPYYDSSLYSDNSNSGCRNLAEGILSYDLVKSPKPVTSESATQTEKATNDDPSVPLCENEKLHN